VEDELEPASANDDQSPDTSRSPLQESPP
jgi:hypothetical protein